MRHWVNVAHETWQSITNTTLFQTAAETHRPDKSPRQTLQPPDMLREPKESTTQRRLHADVSNVYVQHEAD